MDASGNVVKKGPAAEDDEPEVQPLDEDDIDILRNYGIGPYTVPIRNVEGSVKSVQEKINKIIGIRESDTGLAPPSQWDLAGDQQMMKQEQALQVVLLLSQEQVRLQCSFLLWSSWRGEHGYEYLLRPSSIVS